MLKESLENSGLSSKEVLVYLALLELGQSKVAAISRKTRLSRSTLYSVLDALIKRDLVFELDAGKIKAYAPQHPQKIVRTARERADRLHDAFPELKKLYDSAQTVPHITFYEGREALKGMYRDLLSRRSLKAYDIIAAEAEWLKIDPHFFKEFKNKRAEAGIRTRLILEHSPIALERKEDAAGTLSEVKIIPPGFGWKFTAGCYIFPDRVIFVAYKKELVACEIFSAEIASLHQMMFEFMWRSLAF